jgi:hypothetical protein
VAAVRAGGEPLVIRVHDDARASAYLEGTLVDAADQPRIEGQQLSVAMDGFRVHAGRTMALPKTDPRTGWFRLGPLPPGNCTLTFAGSETVELTLRDLVLHPRATTHLGKVVVPAAGIVRAEFEAEEGLRPSEVHVLLEGAGGNVEFTLDRATLRGQQPMPPGRYRVKVHGPGFRWLDQTLEVEAGGTATVRGRLRAAVRVGLRFHVPLGERGVTLVIRDATGAVVFDAEIDPGSSHEDFWPFLERGTFQVESSGKSGRLYGARFTVEGAARTAIPIDLRVEPMR